MTFFLFHALQSYQSFVAKLIPQIELSLSASDQASSTSASHLLLLLNDWMLRGEISDWLIGQKDSAEVYIDFYSISKYVHASVGPVCEYKDIDVFLGDTTDEVSIPV